MMLLSKRPYRVLRAISRPRPLDPVGTELDSVLLTRCTEGMAHHATTKLMSGLHDNEVLDASLMQGTRSGDTSDAASEDEYASVLRGIKLSLSGRRIRRETDSRYDERRQKQRNREGERRHCGVCTRGLHRVAGQSGPESGIFIRRTAVPMAHAPSAVRSFAVASSRKISTRLEINAGISQLSPQIRAEVTHRTREDHDRIDDGLGGRM